MQIQQALYQGNGKLSCQFARFFKHELAFALAFAINGKDYSVILPAGTHTVPSLVLQEGSTQIGITGTGRVTFTYRKGAL